MRLTYNYGATNNNGNLQSVSYLGGGLSYTQTFGYDTLNRLTTSGESSGAWSQTNNYDRYGNRAIDLGGGNQNLYFNAANRITNAGYAYDTAGNLTSDGIQSFAYDAENKIKTVNGVSDVYRYDGDSNRIRKNFTTGEKVRMVYSGGQLIAEYDLVTGSLKKEYIYGAKGLVATIEPGIGTRYTTSDHLGSPRVITNSSAGVVSRHDYMPFGEELGSGVGGRTTGNGYGVSDGIRQQFTRQERDSETGLDYFLARYYSAGQGRFTSPDPFKIVAEVQSEEDPSKARSKLAHYLMQPQLWNQYPYAVNNPLKYIDPTGEIIELTGTPEEQQAALERIRAMLGEERFAFVKQSTVNGHIQLTIDAADIFKFAAIGNDSDNKEFSAGMANILANSKIAEFRVAEKFEFKDANGVVRIGYTGTGCFISDCGNGGVTLPPSQNASGSGNYQIFVHPDAGKQATKAAAGLYDLSGGKGSLVSSNDMVDAHEFGHVSEFWRPRVVDANPRTKQYYKPDSVVFENAIRSRYSSPLRRVRH